MMRMALVTGSAGFIGRHMAAELAQQDWTVSECDLVDGRDCRDLFATYRYPFDLVVHCAAVIGGRVGMDGQPLAVAQNLGLDAAMFDWAVRSKVRRVVYFSSSAVYPTYLQGRHQQHRLAENKAIVPSPYQPGRRPGAGYFTDVTMGSPDGTYGWAKLTGEYLAGFAEAAGVPVHIFRPFSGYGTDQALDYPFPSFIDRARRRADPFEIWGDGLQVRDFVHVDDIVATIMAAIGQDYREALNIGTGLPTSMDDLAHLVCAGTPGAYRPRFAHRIGAPVGNEYRVADVSRLVRFRPPQITLEEGIHRALMA